MINKTDAATESIKINVAKLDKLFEHRSRLTICVLLMSYDRIAFKRFKELLQETDGNLGAQLRKLENENYIYIEKEFENRRPVSWYSITEKGQTALQEHLAGVDALLGVSQTNK